MVRIVKRKRGDVLMPAQFPDNVVLTLKSRPREWSGQYQQDPVPQSGQIFDPSWWRYYKTKEVPEFELIVLSIDCTFRATSTSDFVCLQKWGQVGSRSYLLDCRTERLGFAATKAAIKIMQREGRPASAVLIEAKSNGDAVIEELKNDSDFGAAVIAIEPEGGKESRAHAASVDCEAGNVYLPEDQPWVAALLRSTAMFPGAKHDDDVDALSQFLGWRRTRNLRYGLLELFSSGRAEEIESRPLPVPVIRKHVVPAEVAPICPLCKQPKNIRKIAVAGGYWCVQCGVSMDPEGRLTMDAAKTIVGVDCCGDAKEEFARTGKPFRTVIGSETRCIACGKQSGHRPEDPTIGITFKQLRQGVRQRGQFALGVDIGWRNTFGRFG